MFYLADNKQKHLLDQASFWYTLPWKWGTWFYFLPPILEKLKHIVQGSKR